MRAGSLSPSDALRSSSPTHEEEAVDLSTLPPVYVIPAHLEQDELHDVEDSLIRCHANLTYDAAEARLFISSVNTKKRAQFELRKLRIWTEETTHWKSRAEDSIEKRSSKEGEEHPRKRRKISPSIVSISSEEPTEDDRDPSKRSAAQFHGFLAESNESLILVFKVQWLKDLISNNHFLDISDYLVFEGKRVERPSDATSEPPSRKGTNDSLQDGAQDQAEDILERARADTPPRTKGRVSRFISAPHGSRRFKDQLHQSRWGDHDTEKMKLLQLETSSQEKNSSQETSSDPDIPPPPDWVTQNLKYACQRSTPEIFENEEFLDLLRKIRLARLLTGDEIGVRAYSTSIAAIAAMPTKIISPKEILRLPGCDVKIANLWIEYKNTGQIEAAFEVDTDETMQILNKFYQIWGVGDKTSRDFFDRGWRDVDDIVEYGWNQLSRVQQIGVKYYDEFQQGIPRPEVESILAKVLEHAVRVRDDGIEALVVGGYRRGKLESGDVDIIVSHRQLDKTANLVTDIVASLEEEGWVTHTLRLDLTNTHRGQNTLPLKGSPHAIGSGFDTLDKAMVVWQDIDWPTKEEDLKKDPKAKNPNVHRRVDIIVSAWRTAGCAVLGWSGGTTFQRDIRRYAKYIKEWKFDSSGIRNRRTADIVRLEGPNGVTGSMVDAEKAVFEGLGLVYREPWERCTG
jgi:DNA polymerase IV